MNLVFVDQERNIKNVVELYKKIKKEINKIVPKLIKDIKIFLDFKISSNLLLFNFNELKFSGLSMKPLLLPIFRNLFFLALKICSGVISLKFRKFFLIEFRIFSKIKFLSL